MKKFKSLNHFGHWALGISHLFVIRHSSFILAPLSFILALLFLTPVSASEPQFSQGQAITGQPAGIYDTATVTVPYRFHFDKDKQNFLMTYADGREIKQEDVYTAYVSSGAMRIYCDGEEYVLSHGLKPVGEWLSGDKWDDPDVPPSGKVAIDPKTGRFKFKPTGWKNLEKISLGTYEYTYQPSVACFGNRAIAVFQGSEMVGGNLVWNVYARLWEGNWQSESQVSTEFIADYSKPRPQIVFNSTGTALCVWAGDDELKFSKLPAGTTAWQSPQSISGTQNASFPRLASSGDKLICVFKKGNNLYSKEYNGQNWADNKLISSGLGGTVTPPAVCLNSEGKAWCVFQKSEDCQLWVSKLEPAGWSESEEISGFYSKNSDIAFSPVSETGICVFQQNRRIYAREWTSQGWEDKITIDIDTATAYGAEMPAIAFAPDGNAGVVYVQAFGEFGAEQKIYFVGWVDDKWQTPEPVKESGQPSSPQIAYGQDKAICVFCDSSDVWASIYDIGNAPVGKVTVDYFYREETVAPNQINDLTGLTGDEGGTIEISFTAPGDNGTEGTADHYIVKYSTMGCSSCSPSEWLNPREYFQSWSPLISGTTENFTLYLHQLTTYWLVIKAIDDCGNEADWSNIISVWVDEDKIPPPLDLDPTPAETNQQTVIISGITEPGSSVNININGTVWTPAVGPEGKFTQAVNLKLGKNVIEIIPQDVNGNSSSYTINILYSSAKKNVDNVIAYPNPCKQDKLFFAKLPKKATIRIYNIAGELVKTVQKDDYTDTKEWGLDNDAQQKVASGVYIWLITDVNGEKKVGKLAVIR